MNTLMRSINAIARCATLYRDGKLKGTGLSGSQSVYVSVLCSNPGITQEQLAQRLHVNRSSVTHQMTLLEKGGFITRCRNASDRRTIEVYPTEKMEAMLPALQDIYMQWRAALTDHMPEKEVEMLESLLSEVAVRAEEIV